MKKVWKYLNKRCFSRSSHAKAQNTSRLFFLGFCAHRFINFAIRSRCIAGRTTFTSACFRHFGVLWYGNTTYMKIAVHYFTPRGLISIPAWIWFRIARGGLEFDHIFCKTRPMLLLSVCMAKLTSYWNMWITVRRWLSSKTVSASLQTLHGGASCRRFFSLSYATNQADRPHVGIVGSGPAGFYTAQQILKVSICIGWMQPLS